MAWIDGTCARYDRAAMGMFGQVLIYPRVETPSPRRGLLGVLRKSPPPAAWNYPLAEAPETVGLAIIKAMERTELLAEGSAISAAGAAKPFGPDRGYFRDDASLAASWIEYKLPASALHPRMDRLVVTLTEAQTNSDLDDPENLERPRDGAPAAYPLVTVRVGRSLAKLGRADHFRAADEEVARDSESEEIEASTFAIVELDHEVKLNPAIHRLKDSKHAILEELRRLLGLPIECCVECG